MHTGLTLRRFASGLFIVALVALLVAPVGSVARLPQAQAAVGSIHSKAITPAARTHQTASKFDSPDRFQLDPVTSPAGADEASKAATPTIDRVSPLSAEVRGSDPTGRGPPAL